MAFELTLELAGLLFAVALAAGFIDAIAGGGGLLTIPALMWAGLSPTAALATNKLQACGGSFSATLYFVRKGFVNLRDMRSAIICAFIGSALGTVAVQQIDAAILQLLLPFLMLGIAGYFLFSKRISTEDRQRSISPSAFALTIGFGVGFYDGFFGPGTGSFYALGFVTLAGFGLAKATAHAKLLNFSTNVASLLFFALGGQVVWVLGFVMMGGQVLGALLGSRLVITKGADIIKPLVVSVSLVMSAKLLWDVFAAGGY